MVEPGQVLAGKFRVERVLGQGGMGVVVAAYHLHLGQRVALKFLLAEAMQHPEAVERFLREARAAVRLKSEHVGRVIDVGTLESGAPYIVMEFLEGHDLSQQLQRGGPMAPSTAVDFVLQACEALAEAHSLSIVHRDLKPANLFLTRGPDGSPLIKVLDFGISKATTGDNDFSLTRTSAVMGSPGYMSPEQLRSTRDVDARSDIWALGVVLFELVSGRTPFNGESITELALRVAMDPTPPMYLPNAPPGFEAVVQRCLEKDRERRFANVAELAAALAPFGPPSARESAARIARVLQVQVALPPTGMGYAPTAAHPHAQSSPHVAHPASQPHHPNMPAQAPTTLSNASGQTGYGGQGGGGKSKAPLFIGLGVVVAGAAIALAVVLGGGGKSSEPSAAGGGSDETTPPALPAAAIDAGVAVTPPPPVVVDAAVAAVPPPVVDAAAVATAPVVDDKKDKKKSSSSSKKDKKSGSSSSSSGSSSGSSKPPPDDEDDFSGSRY